MTRPRRSVVPRLAAVAALATTLAAVGLGAWTQPVRARHGMVVAQEALAAAEWESDLFDPDSFEAGDELDDFDDLPPESAAIDGLLLGG